MHKSSSHIRHNTEHLKQIFPEKEMRGHSPISYIQVSVSDLYIPSKLLISSGGINFVTPAANLFYYLPGLFLQI
jgi:hypothetical protein